LIGWRPPPRCAQRSDRLGQRELLTRKSLDETTAADFAATFEPTKNAD
jgi:hypothetical protein